jgi:hypothetical protein
VLEERCHKYNTHHSGRMIKRAVCLPALMWSIKYPCRSVHVCALGAMTCLNTKGRALGGYYGGGVPSSTSNVHNINFAVVWSLMRGRRH